MRAVSAKDAGLLQDEGDQVRHGVPHMRCQRAASGGVDLGRDLRRRGPGSGVHLLPDRAEVDGGHQALDCGGELVRHDSELARGELVRQVEDLEGEVETRLDVGVGSSEELVDERTNDPLTPNRREAEPSKNPIGIVWMLQERPQQ